MLVFIRGGGDLASGVALRLHKCGFDVIISELPKPLPVRRFVSFASAIYHRRITIEGITGEYTSDLGQVKTLLNDGNIPVLIDPECDTLPVIKPNVIVDGRMLKRVVDRLEYTPQLLVGLGPGFSAGVNCDAVIETKRGPFLGRVYWQGEAEPDTGIPEPVNNFASERVIRSPGIGVFTATKAIGDCVKQYEAIGKVNDINVLAPIEGMVRGLIMDGVPVTENMKIGDIDPRMDARLTTFVSDKALAIGGGVLEAILTKFRHDCLSKSCC